MDVEQPSNMEATSRFKIVTEDDTNKIIKIEKTRTRSQKQTQTRADGIAFSIVLMYTFFTKHVSFL